MRGLAVEKRQSMMTADEEDRKKRTERARETGLFRYSLVQELLEPGLSLAASHRPAWASSWGRPAAARDSSPSSS